MGKFKRMNRIKVEMAEKNLNNVQLGTLIGKDPNSISRIANNRSQPTIATLFDIAEALECEPSTLLRTIAEAKEFDKKK